MTAPAVDLDLLLKLRLLVARFGEMDLARWWNTKGQLGRLGATTLRRGFPRTHRFAQARSVFAVAAHRCAEVFEPPGCVTLWRLPEETEAEFDARWEHWLDNAMDWTPFFERLETLEGNDLTLILRAFEVVSDRDVESYSRLRRSAEGRAVPLPGEFSSTDADIALLALGFARGEPGALCPLREEGGRVRSASRANVASSFTVVKGAMIEETYTVFSEWDYACSKRENLDRLRSKNFIGAGSATWLRDVAKVLNRRFEPQDRDWALIHLAKADCSLDEWKPLLLWHMIRDEFLVRDFLQNWLFPLYESGAFRIRSQEVASYLADIGKRGATTEHAWSEATTKRVAAGLLTIAADFGLLRGSVAKEFTSYHLPERSFLYLLHALRDDKQSPGKIIASPDWRLFLMHPSDVEHELLRLHQFRKLEYQVAGSLVQLTLPLGMPAEKFGRIHHLPAAQLAAVIDGMRDRGLIGDDGWLSEPGRAVKQRVEALTDGLATRPYESLEPDELDELMATLEPLATLLLAAQD